MVVIDVKSPAYTGQVLSGYLGKVLSPTHLMERVGFLARELAALHERKPFEAIAFRGISGAAAAFPLSLALGVPCLLVRKPWSEEVRHSSSPFEGAIDAKTYVIVDDFVASGSTLKAIAATLMGPTSIHSGRQLVGVGLYNSSDPRDTAQRVQGWARDGDLGDLAWAPDDLPVICLPDSV